ncbi:MAG: hypothetical protein II760_03955 [Lachnospiraceae bacterium]|nr:hypothetical protein [Lachnospiraceae bacterium]
MNRKKRAYMRGIGVGMFVTALILIIARINTKAEISDAEIISRAHELGMIESDSLSLSAATDNSDVSDQDQGSGSNLYPVLVPTGDQAEPDTQTDPGTQTDPDSQADSDVQTQPDVQPDDTSAAQPDDQTDADTQPVQVDYVILQVERGNSSNVVAEKLQRLGVIDNAKDFDNYLVNNGYANRISVGTFQIPIDSSYEWIAKKITNSL